MTYQRFDGAYFTARFTPDAGRTAVWRAVAHDLERRFLGDARVVLELGCGYGDLINALHAPRRLARDVADVAHHLDGGVEFLRGDATDLSPLEAGTVDAVLASNLLEHLPKPDVSRLVAEARRVLRPGGLLLLIQPNFRLCADRYFDDYTHESIWTDEALCGFLSAHGLTVQHRQAGYLPFSFQSRLPKSYWLTRLYLAARSPVGGRQMLVVATTARA